MKEKTFHKTLYEIFLNPKKAKKCFADKRLTKTEKNIIEAFLMIRDNQNLQAIQLLEGTVPSELMFVESQRLYVLGIAANNISQYQQAEKQIFASIEILKKLDQHYFHFVCYFALFWIYDNLNETQRMEKMLNEMQKIPVENDYQARRLLRCQFTYYQKVQDDKSALMTMKKLEAARDQFSESDCISYLIDKFVFMVQSEDLKSAYAVLEEMKNYRKYQLSENFQFMKKLLDHLTKNDPIYAYDKDFKEVPFLFHQIKVIQSLEENNFMLANQHWAALHEISPKSFKENFTYIGGKCLFSLCLEKHKQKLNSPVELPIDQNLPKLDILIKLLSSSPIPLSAGFLFESIWGRLPEDKEDLMKISRLISRAKTENNIKIEARKGTYQIKKMAAQKAS